MDISWKIDKLEWNASTGLLILAYWTVKGVDGTLSFEYSGTARFPESIEDSNCVYIDGLTEQSAITAVKNNLSNVYSIEDFVRGELEKQKNSEELVSGLPKGFSK